MRFLLLLAVMASLLVAPALSPLNAAPTPIDLKLQLRFPGGGDESPGHLRVRLVPMSDAVDEQQLSVDVVAGEHPSVKLPAGGEWEVCAWAPGYWSECRRTVIDESEEGAVLLPLDLWISGRVTGTFVLPKAEEGSENPRSDALPEQVYLQFVPPDRHEVRIEVPRGPAVSAEGSARVEPIGTARAGTAPLPESSSQCRVDVLDDRPEVARWSCFMPAGMANLQVRPVGFVPRYYWDVQVPPGEDLDLGPITLRQGASVSGSVVVEGGAPDPDTCTVSLIPAVVGGADRRGAQRQIEKQLRSSVGPRGRFQLAGVPPGTYLLQAEQPGLASARIGPIEVWDDAESVLREPLVLRPPLTLDVEIRPAADWLGRSWKVTVRPTSDFGGRMDLSSRAEEVANAAGRASVADLAPGVYTVQVFDSTGQSFHFDQAVRLETPNDSLLEIEIPLVLVEGEVSLGEQPLPSTLWFGGRHGAQSAELVTDEEGRFVGALPRGGRWRVELEAPQPSIATELSLDVEPDRSGSAEVEIEVPDTRVFGTVFGATGEPVQGVRVTLQSDGQGSTGFSGEGGGFELRGFEPGPVSIKAVQEIGNRSLESSTEFFRVLDETPYGPIPLRLRSLRRLTGRVLSPTGLPAAGAIVQLSVHRPLEIAYQSAHRTAEDGTFVGETSDGAEVLQAVVLAPGHALTVMEVAPEEPIVLRPEETGGTLVIQGEPELDGSGLRLIVFRGELSIPIPTLLNWARSQGVAPAEEDYVIRVPSVAPGHYRACLASIAVLVASVLDTGFYETGLSYCDEGFLTAGSELLLDVRRPDSLTDQ